MRKHDRMRVSNSLSLVLLYGAWLMPFYVKITRYSDTAVETSQTSQIEMFWLLCQNTWLSLSFLILWIMLVFQDEFCDGNVDPMESSCSEYKLSNQTADTLLYEPNKFPEDLKPSNSVLQKVWRFSHFVRKKYSISFALCVIKCQQCHIKSSYMHVVAFECLNVSMR